MNTAHKLTVIAENEQKVYDAGKEIGYNIGLAEGIDIGETTGKESESLAWWNCVTNNNTRTTYDGIFRETNFNYLTGGWDPPYTLKPIYAVNMFMNAYGVSKVTKEQIDFSNCLSFNCVFSYCYDLVEIEEIVVPGKDSAYMVSGCSKLKTIGKLIAENGISGTWAFSKCTSLENITIEGIIDNNQSFQDCTKLSHDSLMSIINALVDKSSDTSGTTWTITLGETNKAKLTAEELQIAENKGWTVN